MNEIEFWSIIGMLNWHEAGDDEAVVEPVVQQSSGTHTFRE
jgi:hypothetical protein